jgi:hypothetical protein
LLSRVEAASAPANMHRNGLRELEEADRLTGFIKDPAAPISRQFLVGILDDDAAGIATGKCFFDLLRLTTGKCYNICFK